MRPSRLALAVVTAALAATSGCGFGARGLAFTNDNRLRIVAPEDRATLRLPVRLDWEIEDFDIAQPDSGDGDGYFAVFIDHAPVPPGRTLAHVARDDRDCRAVDGCPDRDYLEGRGIYTTTETELELETLRRTGREGRREFHDVTVILLDTQGRRISESAWHVRFELERGVLS